MRSELLKLIVSLIFDKNRPFGVGRRRLRVSFPRFPKRLYFSLMANRASTIIHADRGVCSGRMTLHEVWRHDRICPVGSFPLRIRMIRRVHQKWCFERITDFLPIVFEIGEVDIFHEVCGRRIEMEHPLKNSDAFPKDLSFRTIQTRARIRTLLATAVWEETKK